MSDGNKRILISTYISLVAHLEHICIFTDFTEAFCVCLGFLWLDVKIDKIVTSLEASSNSILDGFPLFCSDGPEHFRGLPVTFFSEPYLDLMNGQ